MLWFCFVWKVQILCRFCCMTFFIFLRLSSKQDTFWMNNKFYSSDTFQRENPVSVGCARLKACGRRGWASARWVDSRREAPDRVCMRMARVLWTFCSFHPNSMALLQLSWNTGLQVLRLFKYRPHAPHRRHPPMFWTPPPGFRWVKKQTLLSVKRAAKFTETRG